MTTCIKNMTLDEVREKVKLLAKRLAEDPADHGAELDVERLRKQYGEWIYTALVDAMTEGTEDCLPQQNESMPGLVVDCTRFCEIKNDSALTGFLSDLTQKDFECIPSEARLNVIERQVWEYSLEGKDANAICELIVNRQGLPYHPNSVRRIIASVRDKVWSTPSIGWRTAMAEDVHRGPTAHPPARVSWLHVA